MQTDRYCILSIVLSLSGMAAALLIWVTGAHQFGVFPQIWQLTGIGGLLVICTIIFAISILAISKITAVPGRGIFSVPLVTLLICMAPFIFFLFILTIRLILGKDFETGLANLKRTAEQG